MSSDLLGHLESLGVSFPDSPAAADYAKAETEDELHCAAGEHLALHAAAITTSLHLPRRGSAVLRAMKHLSKPSWQRYWTLQNEAFTVSALIDLCTVRSVFKEEARWPELAPLVDRVFVMACIYRGRAIKLTPEETELFRGRSTTHLVGFHGNETVEEQIEHLMAIDELRKERIHKPAFVKATFVERSWVDPWALSQHHDRIAAIKSPSD